MPGGRMSGSLLHNLAVVMAVAGVVSVLFHRIKQPVVLGYVLAGLIIGPHTTGLPLVTDEESIHTLSELGVVFLLFGLGLEFNLRKLARVGLPAGMTALLEIGLMTWMGYHVGLLFGWTLMDSLFLGAMMSISSSMFLVKALTERGQHKSPFAQMIFGIAIFEDILGVVMLGLLSGIALTQTVSVVAVAGTLGRLAVFLVTVLVLGLLAVPPLIRYIGRHNSAEMLLVGVLGICFGSSLLAVETGFSAALGAFLAGALVAEARENRRIIALVEPVRDLFTAIFFVAVGMMLKPDAIVEHAVPIILITAAVLTGRTFAITLGTLLAGSSPRSAVQVGMSMAQIGEFAFIIAALGLKLGVIDEFLYPVAVSVSVLTILFTPQMMRWSGRAGDLLERGMPKPLLAALMAYSQWLATLRDRTPAADMVRQVLRRSFIQICVNLLIGAGLFISAAGIAGRLDARAGWWDRMPAWTGGINTVFWFSVLLVVLPFWVAIVRKVRAVGMILAEMAVPVNIPRDQIMAFRSIVGNVVFTVGILLAFFWLLMLSALILPPWPMLVFLMGVAALVALLLRGSFIRLYARGQVMLREMFANPLETQTGVPPAPMPELMRAAQMETVTLPGGSAAVGLALREVNLRALSGASIIGIDRGGSSIVNPGPEERFEAGDTVLLMGDTAQLARAAALLTASGEEGPDEEE